jgi:hypothetical protein
MNEGFHMTTSRFCLVRRYVPKFAAFFLCVLLFPCLVPAQVTLLVPSRTSVEAPVSGSAADAPGAEPSKAKGKSSRGKTAQNKDDKIPALSSSSLPTDEQPQNADVLNIEEETDLLITMMHPFNQTCLAMDMPELFAVLRYDNATPAVNGILRGERRDLLGDVEEILYLDQKAWGANVALQKPGLYQFIIDARPWWDAPRGRFIQHFVKTMLPVHGVERGWDTPVGQRLEIQPLTRPFGLTAPVLFSGRALLNGRPLQDAAVRLVRINTDKSIAPTPWHEELAGITDMSGQFSFIANQPGWWCCTVQTAADPLVGPDGSPRRLELSALFWFYVSSPQEIRRLK